MRNDENSGLVQRENRHDLQWECQEDLFRQDVQNADDIRFDISLLRTCMADKLQFCGHIQYGAILAHALRNMQASSTTGHNKD